MYADFSRIILCTKKKTVANSLAYVEYVGSSITSKDLYHSIDMSVTQVMIAIAIHNTGYC